MVAVETRIPRKIWTREEADRIPPEGLSLELVDGVLIDRPAKNASHNDRRHALRGWLETEFGREHVRFAKTVDVAPGDNATNEPAPDLSVTYSSSCQTRGANPQPEDLLLVVEVSDSTFAYDRDVKGPLYARAGIPEYWILDVGSAVQPRLLVHLEPVGGIYQTVRTYNVNETFTVLDGRELCMDFL